MGVKKSFVKRHRASFWLSLLSYPIASVVSFLLSRVASLLPGLLPETLWPLIPSFHADVCTYCLVLSLNVLSALLFADRALGAAEKPKEDIL